MKICFLSLSGLTFNVATPETQPLGGTESSFCYLARELAKTHDVTLVARNCPKQDIMGVHHDNEVDVNTFDVVISNAPIKFTGPCKPYYIFWNHLAHFDVAIKSLLFSEIMAGIDCIVYVSNWQKNECEKWFGKAKKTVVIGNGLTPAFENMFESAEDISEAKETRFTNAVYTSTPYRGLRLIPKIMDELDGINFRSYSGLDVYQGDDKEYKGIYDSLRKRGDCVSVGNVSQTELAERLKQSQYMLYPCVFPETFCIAALEAMAAGLDVVTTNLAALPETLNGHGWLVKDYDGVSEDVFVAKFCDAVVAAQAGQTDRDEWAQRKWLQVQYVNKNCTWRVRANSWQEIFAGISTSVQNQMNAG